MSTNPNHPFNQPGSRPKPIRVPMGSTMVYVYDNGTVRYETPDGRLSAPSSSALLDLIADERSVDVLAWIDIELFSMRVNEYTDPDMNLLHVGGMGLMPIPPVMKRLLTERIAQAVPMRYDPDTDTFHAPLTPAN